MKRLFLSVIFLTIGLTQTTYSFENFTIDEQSEIDGIKLSSGKLDSTRMYSATVSREIDVEIENLRKAITEFESRCNNQYRDKRKYTEENFTCTQKNANLIESIRINDIKSPKSEPNKINEFLLARYVYNRGLYHFYDHIIEKSLMEDHKRVYIIQQTMLTDDEAMSMLGSNINKRDTVFLQARGIFTLKEISATKTSLTYEYSATTEHWLLNKNISVGNFFSSTAESLSELMEQLTLSALKHSAEKQKTISTVSKNP
ncbi:MAG: hypothetical protein JNM93_06020 [Bacteriovoracaceae bacterium]|nr:hypothetical protein [Bacteriovoracaceae bacterium]